MSEDFIASFQLYLLLLGVFCHIRLVTLSVTVPSPLFHLLNGTTDPVTAATSNKARLIYAAGIGILIYVIRTWGAYPDAVAFAVLLMNMAAPTIDYYVKS